MKFPKVMLLFFKNTFDIPVHGMNAYELPYLYWIPKLHKNPYRQRYFAGYNKYSTKPPSLLLTKILTTVKEKLQISCVTTYARSGV
jgi:hypothetical protein